MISNFNNQSSLGRNFLESNLEEKILSRAASFRTPAGPSPQAALILLRSRIEAEPVIPPVKVAMIRTMEFRLASMAASLLIILGFWFLFHRGGYNQVVADRGTHLEHRLPDGSQVTMNADSKISYNNKAFSAVRKVGLNGEAFFSVVKGSRFVVSTKNGEIAVLGTSFNVFSRGDIFRVSCITGRVRVTSDGSTVDINPGENAELGNDLLVSTGTKHAESSTAWIKGEFNFENSPLNQVLSELERQFNVKFVTGNLEGRYFTGTFTNKDLKNSLDIVCIPMGLAYVVGEKGRIYIKEKTLQ